MCSGDVGVYVFFGGDVGVVEVCCFVEVGGCCLVFFFVDVE